MLLDFDPDVTAVSSQPFWLRWCGEDGRDRRHAPDFFARLADGTGVVVDIRLNAYLRDDDEYRAITRQTIIRGLAGTITCTPQAITVELHRPGAPRVARAPTLLIDEINHTPPAMPGDTRPITYQLAKPAQAI